MVHRSRADRVGELDDLSVDKVVAHYDRWSFVRSPQHLRVFGEVVVAAVLGDAAPRQECKDSDETDEPTEYFHGVLMLIPASSSCRTAA